MGNSGPSLVILQVSPHMHCYITSLRWLQILDFVLVALLVSRKIPLDQFWNKEIINEPNWQEHNTLCGGLETLPCLLFELS